MEAELERWRRGEKVSSEEQISVDMEKSMVSSVVEGNASPCSDVVELLYHPQIPLSCWFSLMHLAFHHFSTISLALHVPIFLFSFMQVCTYISFCFDNPTL